MGLFINSNGNMRDTINSNDSEVKSVNEKIGNVILTAEDIKTTDGSTVEAHLANYVVKKLAVESNITFLSGAKDGTMTIDKIEGKTLYKRFDGTYTFKWEEGVALESVGEIDPKVEITSKDFNNEIIDKIYIILNEPLRGLPNGVRDEIKADGTIIRRIGIGLYKEGDEKNIDFLTNKTYTYYQLNDPIIEKTTPLKSLQCFKNGSITINSNMNPFITIKYPTNLNNRLQMLEEDINKIINTKTIPYDNKNFNVSYEYYEDGRVKKEIITGDIERTTEYSYSQKGFKNEGKVLMEIVKENGQRTSRTFFYNDDGNITSIQVITDKNIP